MGLLSKNYGMSCRSQVWEGSLVSGVNTDQHCSIYHPCPLPPSVHTCFFLTPSLSLPSDQQPPLFQSFKLELLQLQPPERNSSEPLLVFKPRVQWKGLNGPRGVRCPLPSLQPAVPQELVFLNMSVRDELG